MDVFLLTHKLYEQNTTKISTNLTDYIPNEIIVMLDHVNSNSYANGFFNFVNPDGFKHYFSLWDLNPIHCIPFIKCAFGHLIFYHQQQYKVLNPVYNCVDVLGEVGELDFVMNIMLCDRQGLESSFLIDVYEQAFGKLGAPQIDEIYAFIPALKLGGYRSASSVQKVNMSEQMSILSQL